MATLLAVGIPALAAFVYFLFQAPLPCGAPIRDTADLRRLRDADLPGGELHCRHNSRGLLRGCRQVQQHKWQRLKMALIPARWGTLLGQLPCLPTLGEAPAPLLISGPRAGMETSLR
jgi:hypothetical protein